MSLSRVKPAGWSANETFTSAQANQLDTNVSNALDKTVAGDSIAGTVTVASGGGISLAAGSTLTGSASATLAGTFSLGAAAKLTTAGTGTIELANNDFPTLKAGHTGRSKTRRHWILENSPLGTVGTWAAAAVANLGIGLQHTATTASAVFLVPLTGLHNGATLDSVDVWFRPSNDARGGSLAGITAPLVYVLRSAAVTSNALVGAASTIGTSAYAFPSYADYTAQKMQKVSSVVGAVVDNASYLYWLYVADETGGAAALNNIYTHFDVVYSSITDLRHV